MNYKQQASKAVIGTMIALGATAFTMVAYDVYKETQLLPYKKQLHQIDNRQQNAKLVLTARYNRAMNKESMVLDSLQADKDGINTPEKQLKLARTIINMDSIRAAHEAAMAKTDSIYDAQRQAIIAKMDSIYKYRDR